MKRAYLLFSTILLFVSVILFSCNHGNPLHNQSTSTNSPETPTDDTEIQQESRVIDLRIKKGGNIVSFSRSVESEIEECNEPYMITSFPEVIPQSAAKNMVVLRKHEGGIEVNINLDENWINQGSIVDGVVTNKRQLSMFQLYWIDANDEWNTFMNLVGEKFDELNRTGTCKFIYPLTNADELNTVCIQFLSSVENDKDSRYDFEGFYKITSGGGIGHIDPFPKGFDVSGYILINDTDDGFIIKDLIPVEADKVYREISVYGQMSDKENFSWNYWITGGICIDVEDGNGITPISFKDYDRFQHQEWHSEYYDASIISDYPYYALDYSYRFLLLDYPDIKFSTKNFQSNIVENGYFSLPVEERISE